MPVKPVAGQLRPEDVSVVLRGEMPLGVAEYAAAQVAHVTRLSGRPVLAAHAVVSHHGDPAVALAYRAEATLDLAHHRVRAAGDGQRPREAVDAVVDRLERQVVRVVERWQERSRWLGTPEAGHWRHGQLPTQRRAGWADRPVDEREVLRRKSFALESASVDEAVFDMESLGHDFYLFVEAGTGRDAVVHRLDDGGYAVSGVPPARLPDEVAAEPDQPELDEAQARQRLDAGGEPFVFYTDAGTGRGHVAYRRRDGHYGVITPA